MEKSLLNEIADFLEELQKKDSNIKDRQKHLLQNSERRKRIIDICVRSDFVIDQKEPNIVISKKMVKGKEVGSATLIGDYQAHQITIGGIKFLEDYRKGKFQEERDKTQMFLTIGLFSVAFLQGIILLAYNFYDLRLRGFPKEANIFIWWSIIMMIVIFVLLMWISKKLNR